MGLDSFVYRVKDSKKEEVIYWRKANQIHNWFITKLYEDDENNNLVPKTFSSELLDELQEVSQEVLNNKKLASLKLPTCEGFFFGNTDYDDFYFKPENSPVYLVR